MAQLLIQASCTVTVAHSRTRDLPAAVRRADIVVAAVGRPELIRGDWLKPGATVIDVGQERVEQPDGTRKLLGDVAFDEALEVAGAITPVPGGVGPMTIACLLRNTFVAAHRRASLKIRRVYDCRLLLAARRCRPQPMPSSRSRAMRSGSECGPRSANMPTATR